MTLPLDQAIDAAHNEAERIENEARQVEARIVAAGGVPPVRRYGKPVSGEAVSKNLTLTGALQRRDPALAAYLGVGSDYHRKQQESAEAKRMMGQALEMETARLREVNAAAAKHREQRNLAGINTLTGRRWGS